MLGVTRQYAILAPRLGSTCVARVPALLPCHGLQPRGAGVAEMADADVSQASGRKPVRVRIPPPARPLSCRRHASRVAWSCLRGVRAAKAAAPVEAGERDALRLSHSAEERDIARQLLAQGLRVVLTGRDETAMRGDDHRCLPTHGRRAARPGGHRGEQRRGAPPLERRPALDPSRRVSRHVRDQRVRCDGGLQGSAGHSLVKGVQARALGQPACTARCGGIGAAH